MTHTTRSSTPSVRRSRLPALALLGCACAVLPARSSRAQGTPESAPVASNGINVIETGGVYPSGTAGSDHYIDTGASNTHPSFTVLDFNTSSYGLSFPVASVSNINLALTESDFASSKAGSFTIYLTEDTSSIATANGGSPLMYQSANAPGGVGTQLGTSTTFFPLATFTSDASTTATTTDNFSLSLSSTAQTYFVNQLNSSSAADLRLVLVSNDANGYATFLGNTSAVPAASEPTLSFNAVINQPTLTWTPGGANGGSGTWLPANTAGDTSWGGGPWNNTTAVFAGTGGTVAIGTGGVSAQGIQFNSSGYTLGAKGGPAITLVSPNGTTAPVVQVTNATDTATINAPVAGTSGLNKIGAGTLVLGGTNTFTGGVTLSAGTLQISADANLGDPSNAVALSSGTLHPVGALSTNRNFTGNGGIQVDGGSTVNVAGVVNVGNLTLPGAGTLALTNTSFSLGGGGASNAATGTLTFTTAGGTLVTSSDGTTLDGGGVMNLGSVTATHTSGTVTLNAFAELSGTSTVSVVNSGASLSFPGSLNGAAVIAKSGAGTLVLGGDNSGLTGTGTPATSFRQGTAGASPLSGGIVSIASTNPNPGAALGTGLFDANGGTVSNDTGKPVTLAISGISLGAQNAATTPGGLVFTGSGANPSITVTGAISLYRGGTTAYQHTITVNVPTTFTGLLTASANTTTSTGVTFAGTSTLTLAGTTANTLFEPITIATTGANAGVIAAADGTFAANSAITLNAGARLTISTGAMSGTANAINDAALVTFASQGGTFGRMILNIGSAQETVGGLYLAAGDGTLSAGYLPAGTYGSSQSNATYKDNTLFSGTGVINNLGTAMAVPEPATWVTVVGGLGLLAAARRRRGQAA